MDRCNVLLSVDIISLCHAIRYGGRRNVKYPFLATYSFICMDGNEGDNTITARRRRYIPLLKANALNGLYVALFAVYFT